VEDDHTYFVGTANGGAWVHNDCSNEAMKLLGKYGEGSIVRAANHSPTTGDRMGRLMELDPVETGKTMRYHDVFLDTDGFAHDTLRAKKGRVGPKVPFDDWVNSWTLEDPVYFQIYYLDHTQIPGRWKWK
jgi:hypothetical protein